MATFKDEASAAAYLATDRSHWRQQAIIKAQFVMGRTYSGAYYVDEVIHHLTRTEYRQRFKVQRNALAVVGNESFADLRDPEARPQPEPRERIATRRTGKVVAP